MLQFLQHKYEVSTELCFDDVAKLKESPELASVRIDVVTAGFPCQDTSVDGKRQGLAGKVGLVEAEYKSVDYIPMFMSSFLQCTVHLGWCWHKSI